MALDIKVFQGGEGEIVEKKSRFIAHISPVESEQEAMEFVAQMKKKYYDARHNCFAYIIGRNGDVKKFSDDGGIMLRIAVADDEPVITKQMERILCKVCGNWELEIHVDLLVIE